LAKLSFNPGQTSLYNILFIKNKPVPLKLTFPKSHAYITVKRKCLCTNGHIHWRLAQCHTMWRSMWNAEGQVKVVRCSAGLAGRSCGIYIPVAACIRGVPQFGSLGLVLPARTLLQMWRLLYT